MYICKVLPQDDGLSSICRWVCAGWLAALHACFSSMMQSPFGLSWIHWKSAAADGVFTLLWIARKYYACCAYKKCWRVTGWAFKTSWIGSFYLRAVLNLCLYDRHILWLSMDHVIGDIPPISWPWRCSFFMCPLKQLAWHCTRGLPATCLGFG